MHLSNNKLLGKTMDEPEVDFRLPSIIGGLANHLQLIAIDQSQIYLDLCSELIDASTVNPPKVFSREYGWSKYLPDGSSVSVPVVFN
jgi:hypothetical protein